MHGSRLVAEAAAEALVLDAAAGRGDRGLLQATRPGRDEEWEGAEQELVQRGWLNPEGLITEVGIREREELERARNLRGAALLTHVWRACTIVGIDVRSESDVQ